MMDAARRTRILRQHVEADRLLGVEAVPRGAAREMAEDVAEPVRSAATGVSGNRPTGASGAAEGGVGGRQAAEAARPVGPVLDRAEKLRVLQAMDEQEVRPCERCVLCQDRMHTVFGEGDVDAPIMFIGEGPGRDEDEQGRPFVGRAGELLDRMIKAMGFDREQVYIANVVKCRPPNNRTPVPEEVQACWDFLRRQIETVRPRVIVTLGAPATKMILNTTTGITRLRGTWHEYAGINPPIPVMPTFHPAYLLRSYTNENRARVWADLQAVMQRL